MFKEIVNECKGFRCSDFVLCIIVCEVLEYLFEFLVVIFIFFIKFQVIDLFVE